MPSCQGDGWSFGFAVLWSTFPDGHICCDSASRSSGVPHKKMPPIPIWNTQNGSTSVTTATVTLRWSYLWVEAGVLHTHGGIHQTPAQLSSSGVLADLGRSPAVCDYESLPEQQGRQSELRDKNRQPAAERDSGPPADGHGDTHLSVKVSSCQADGAQADSVAAMSDPGDDVLVVHVLHWFPVDGQEQISVLHPSRLGRTPQVHLPQKMNWDRKQSLAYQRLSRVSLESGRWACPQPVRRELASLSCLSRNPYPSGPFTRCMVLATYGRPRHSATAGRMAIFLRTKQDSACLSMTSTVTESSLLLFVCRATNSG